MSLRSILHLILLSSSVLASQVLSVPACGQPCIDGGFAATTCPDEDYACLCTDATFIDSVASCLATSCPTDAITQTEDWAANLCTVKTGKSDLSALAEAVAAVQSVSAVSSQSAVPASMTTGSSVRDQTASTTAASSTSSITSSATPTNTAAAVSNAVESKTSDGGGRVFETANMAVLLLFMFVVSL